MHTPRRRWVKLWTQELLYGTTSTELTLESQAIFVKFIALAGDSPVPGTICVAPNIAYTDEQLAMIFKCTVEQLQEAKNDCLKYGKIILNSNCIAIKNWDKYQDARTDYQREYMREYRSGKTNSKQVDSKQVDSKLHSKHVTRPEQTRTEEDHISKIDSNKSIPFEESNTLIEVYTSKEGNNELPFKQLLKQMNELRTDKDRIAFLVNQFKKYHSDAPTQEFENLYGRMGKIVKQSKNRHDLVLKTIWNSSSISIDGYHLDYIQKTVKYTLQQQRKDDVKSHIPQYTDIEVPEEQQ